MINTMQLKHNLTRKINEITSEGITRTCIFGFVLIALIIKTFLYLGFTLHENTYSLDFSLGYGKGSYFMYYYGAFALVFMSFYFLFKNKGKLWFLIFIDLFLTVLILTDLWYFRGFRTVPSLMIVKQTANLDNLSGSVFSMISPLDLIFIIDIIILVFAAFKFNKIYMNTKRSWTTFFITFLISILYIGYVPFVTNVLHKEHSKSYLFGMYDPNDNARYFSPVGYHVFNAYQVFQDLKPYNLTDTEKSEIKNWYDQKNENLPDNEYKGIYKDKNLLVIQVESLESFVIGQTINGKEITPNLNKLVKNSLYFPNIKEQVNEGTSSDSDLMVNTSVYPLRQGSTFFSRPGNTYNSMPLLLQEKGYSTIGIHPDKGPFWNWMQGLKGIGFEKLVDYYSFNIDEVIGLGLSDGSYFKQIVPMLKEQKQPFYSFMVTLTSHGPFDLPEKYRELNLPKELGDNHLGGYFESVHYTDKQLGIFLETLDKEGLLDNTVIAITGDHTGVHKYYNDKIKKLSTQEDWWTEVTWDVPLIIYNKNNPQSKTISTIGGQVDTMPTLLYMMGVEEDKFKNSAMGKILVKTNKNYSVLTNRTLVGKASDEETAHAVKGLDIANKILKSDYFKKYYNK